MKLAVGGGLILSGLMVLAVWAVGRPASVSFYVTPTEVLRDESQLRGHNVRVAGAIVPGTVRRSGERMTFAVTDGRSRIPVSYSGTVPYTFRQTWQTKGWEVVVEGRLTTGPQLDAHNVFVKHPGKMTARDVSARRDS
ncbi:MAG: cytochrome c maturation protein CcmE [Actinomycetota bacterium]